MHERDVKPFLDEEKSLFFSYGTRLSGKTFVLFGSPCQPGIVQQTIIDASESKSATVEFLAIFKEGTYDLLSHLVDN